MTTASAGVPRPALQFDCHKVSVEGGRIQPAIIARVRPLIEAEDGADETYVLDSERESLAVDFHIVVFHALSKATNVLL
jgi:hypothetical protein